MGDSDVLCGVSRIAGQVRLVVFDLDGTLVDSRRDLADAANLLLAESGARTHSEEAIGRMVGEGAATLVARAFAASGVAQPPGALDRFLEIYDGRLLNYTRPYDGIPELLTQLSARYTLAVLTNKPLEATCKVVQGLGLSPFFDARVLGGDGPLPRKPDPAGLLTLIEANGATAATTVMVGDSLVDWQTARAAGTACAMATYGFGYASFPRQELTGQELLLETPSTLLGRL